MILPPEDLTKIFRSGKSGPGGDLLDRKQFRFHQMDRDPETQIIDELRGRDPVLRMEKTREMRPAAAAETRQFRNGSHLVRMCQDLLRHTVRQRMR